MNPLSLLISEVPGSLPIRGLFYSTTAELELSLSPLCFFGKFRVSPSCTNTHKKGGLS
jgi:hypothetical protein